VLERKKTIEIRAAKLLNMGLFLVSPK